MPGHEFDFTADDDGNLQHLTYRLDRLQSVRFRRVRDRFEATEIVREPDRMRIYRRGKIENEQSLFTTCKELGLSENAVTGRYYRAVERVERSMRDAGRGGMER